MFSISSPWSITSSVTTPVAVFGFGVTSFAPTELTLGWSTLSDATGGYEIQYKASSSGTWETAVTKGTADTTHSFTGLTNNTEYNIRIRGVITGTPNTYTIYNAITETLTLLGTPSPGSNFAMQDEGGNIYSTGGEIADNAPDNPTHYQTKECGLVTATSATNNGHSCTNFAATITLPYTTTIPNNRDQQLFNSREWTVTSGQKLRNRVGIRTRKGAGTVASPYIYSIWVYTNLSLDR